MNILIVKRQQDLIKSFIKKHRLSCEIVELGCGDGINLESLSRASLKGQGYDVSEQALEIAQAKKMKGVTVQKGDLFHLKMTDKEMILLLLTLEHLEDDTGALRRINGYLKEDGWLALSVPAHSKKYSYQDRMAGHYRRYDADQLRALLTENGFSVKEILSLGFPLSNILTNGYNFFLKMIGASTTIQTDNTHLTGIAEYRGHFPAGIRQLSYVLFPILSLLRKLDTPFLHTDLGEHYLLFAQKAKSMSDLKGTLNA